MTTYQYLALSGITHLTPPLGSGTSPAYRGMTWMWTWPIVWPAAFPSLSPTLNPAGLNRRFRNLRTTATCDHKCDCSDSGNSNRDFTCFLGMMRVCPRLIANPSLNTRAESVSIHIRSLVKLQNGQLSATNKIYTLIQKRSILN